MTKVVLEAPLKSQIEETSAVPSKIVYAYREYFYSLRDLDLAELNGVEKNALGDLARHVKNGAIKKDEINAFIKEKIPYLSDERISEILERKAFDDLTGKIRKNVMERDEVIAFIKESAPSISDERIFDLLNKLVNRGGLVEKVYRNHLGIEMPLGELYPPVVYFYDSKGYSSSLSGLLVPRGRHLRNFRTNLRRIMGL